MTCPSRRCRFVSKRAVQKKLGLVSDEGGRKGQASAKTQPQEKTAATKKQQRQRKKKKKNAWGGDSSSEGACSPAGSRAAPLALHARAAPLGR